MFYGPGDLRIESVQVPQPGPGEIVVDVRVAATCGTDLKSYRRGHPKLFPSLPARFGHEFAGEVSAVGDGVTTFTKGMRVVAANTAPCGECWACKLGLESQCVNLQFLNGAFAEKILVPARIVARNTYQIPDDVPFDAVVALEPLATVVHGISESGISLGDTVVVHGAGPVGLMFVRLARLRGAYVISADKSPWRLRQAVEFGANATVDLADIDGPNERVSLIRQSTPHARGADVAIEAVGLTAVWEQAVGSLRPGGTAVLFGGPPSGSHASIDGVGMHYNEYTLKGVFHHAPRYVEAALKLLCSGAVNGQELITEERGLDSLVDSLEDMAAGRGSKYALVP